MRSASRAVALLSVLALCATTCSSSTTSQGPESSVAITDESAAEEGSTANRLSQGSRRHPAYWPHSADSIWNIGLGSEAVLADASDQRVRHLRGEDSWAGPAGISYDRFTHPIWITDSEQADVTVVFEDRYEPGSSTCFVNRGAGGSSDDSCDEDPPPISIPIPPAATADPGTCEPVRPGPVCEGDDNTDGSLHIVDDDGVTLYSLYRAAGRGDDWAAARVAVWDLRSEGIAAASTQQWGTRAYGGSDIAGLMRCWELERVLDQRLTTFPHGLALAINGSQFKKGWPKEDTYVWPATTSDSSWDRYVGSVPMGSLVAIPNDVDLEGIETPIGRAIVATLQTYGALVVDQTGGQFALYAEPGCATEALELADEEMTAIQQLATIVVNNTPSSPAGGGEHPAPPPDFDVNLDRPVSDDWEAPRSR